MTPQTVAPAAAGVREWSGPKPGMLFFWINDLGLPEFVNGHFRDHVRCPEQFFDLVVVVEDAAQSQGASSVAGRAGALGRVAGTSIYPGKNHGAAGDGGAVMTNADVEGVRAPVVRAGNEDVWHLYIVQAKEQTRVMVQMSAAGVGNAIHHPTPVHLTRAYVGLGDRRGQFPVAEAAADRILSLPMFPHLTPEQQELVVAELMGATRA